MAQFKKGQPRPKNAGRKAGTPNRATIEIKVLLNEILPPDENRRRWLRFLNHRDPNIGWKAFELAQAYLYGQPVKPIQGKEEAPPIHIDISAIPMKRKRAE